MDLEGILIVVGGCQEIRPLRQGHWVLAQEGGQKTGSGAPEGRDRFRMGMLTGYQEYRLVLRCVFDPKRGPVMLTKGELNRNDLLKITFVDLEQMGKALKDTTNIHLSMRGPG